MNAMEKLQICAFNAIPCQELSRDYEGDKIKFPIDKPKFIAPPRPSTIHCTDFEVPGQKAQLIDNIQCK